jgi:nucleotide-binding universal stress UspA family protein
MTGPLETILAATDGTPAGRLAVVRAASIARTTGAALHAIHVTAPAEEPTELAAEREATEAELRHHLARIHPQPELHVADGTVFVEIIRLARALEADLIVTGAHSGGAARRFFLGTTAGRVARHGDRPLLLVRRPVRGAYRRVLVGVDTSPASADAIGTARAVAPAATILPAMIHRVVGERKLRDHADETGITELRSHATEDRRRELQRFLAEHAGSVETAQPIVEVGDPNDRLPALPGEHRCDLISIGTHGRTRISYALLGSVAEHVLRDTDRDVLLVRHGPTRLHKA